MPQTLKRKSRKLSDFQYAADVFKALSHPSRLLIVDELSHGEQCVQDLTKMVGCDISTVSAHLSSLRNAGIVSTEKRGTQVFYSLSKPCIMNVFCCLTDFRD